MKYFIKSILYFIPFLAIIYALLLFVWADFVPKLFKPNLNFEMGSYGHLHSRLRELRNFSELDILFLGSSHAYRGFDTRLFKANGLKVFNLGSKSQTPIQTGLLLNRYLDQLQPKVIIYEVYPATFCMDGVESALDIIANDQNDFNSLKMALNINHVKVYNTLFYGYLRDVFNLNADFVEPVQKVNDKYISGGYVEKKMSFFNHISYPTQQWEFNEEQFVDFKKIIALCKEKKIKLILVNAPITPNLYKSYYNNNIFDSTMSAHGKYYNFNTILSLNDSLHFSDYHHLNQNGVEIFNKKLIEILNEK